VVKRLSIYGGLLLISYSPELPFIVLRLVCVGECFLFCLGVFNAVCGAIYGLLGSAFLTLLACHYWPAYGPRFIDCWLLKLECMWTADFMPSACCFAVNVGVPALASNH